MRIKKIKIENFRGIINEELEFNKNINVFIGSNGAGKTTLLEAIIASLLKITSSFFGNHFSKKYLITDEDINYTKKYASILLDLDLEDLFDILTPNVQHQDLPLLVKTGLIKDIKTDLKLNQPFNVFSNTLREKIQTENFTLPIIKYYPANRGSVSYTNVSNTNYLNSKLEAWANAIQNNVSYSRFFKWYLEHENQELRMQRDAKDFSIENPSIKYVRLAIKEAFKLLTGKDYILKSNEIKRNGNNSLVPVLAIQEKGSDIIEILDNKSDGEKAIIALVADIAYNLSIAHDFSVNDKFLSSSGIVIIDEIETHLHPNWQREIIPLLTKLFPNIQFFITTHSPQVIASVSSENIFVGENFSFTNINIKSKGTDTNTLLNYVFNATERPKEYIEYISKFRAIIEAEGQVKDLKNIIEQITNLEKEDLATDVSELISELQLELEAYKFELEHEAN